MRSGLVAQVKGLGGACMRAVDESNSRPGVSVHEKATLGFGSGGLGFRDEVSRFMVSGFWFLV